MARSKNQYGLEIMSGASADTYLKDKHYPDIHGHPSFKELHVVLKTKIKTLNEKGMERKTGC